MFFPKIVPHRFWGFFHFSQQKITIIFLFNTLHVWKVIPECVMKIDKIQEAYSASIANKTSVNIRHASAVQNLTNSADSVSFTGGINNLSKKGWFFLRNLSYTMKNVSEVTNAIIAAIGTGIIAPFVILVSPGKGDKNDKDKKKLQALRQPLSAVLALSFQLPATRLVNKGINYLAYQKHIPMFNDEHLGTLIPDTKYLRGHITDAEYSAKLAEFNKADSPLRKTLEDVIKEEYSEVGLTPSAEELARRVEKRKKNFLKDKIVAEKHDALIEDKIKEIAPKKPVIEDIQLVTNDYRDLAKHRFADEFKQIEKEANLNAFDKFIDAMGFSNKKLKALKAAKDRLASERGLEILMEDEKTLFTNPQEKLKRFIKNCEEKSKDMFGKKKFWISLGVNLFMIAASCYALNWAHPRVNELIMKKKAEKEAKAQEVADTQKVEVK